MSSLSIPSDCRLRYPRHIAYQTDRFSFFDVDVATRQMINDLWRHCKYEDKTLASGLVENKANIKSHQREIINGFADCKPRRQPRIFQSFFFFSVQIDFFLFIYYNFWPCKGSIFLERVLGVESSLEQIWNCLINVKNIFSHFRIIYVFIIIFYCFLMD